jgi:hypothetical protein
VGGWRRVSVEVRAPSAGTFASTVSVSTPNDINAANDQRVISLVVNPASPVGASGSGGSGVASGQGGTGGGGATEVGLLLVLCAALRRRARTGT